MGKKVVLKIPCLLCGKSVDMEDNDMDQDDVDFDDISTFCDECMKSKKYDEWIKESYRKACERHNSEEGD